jgi:hypothetical protein
MKRHFYSVIYSATTMFILCLSKCLAYNILYYHWIAPPPCKLLLCIDPVVQNALICIIYARFQVPVPVPVSLYRCSRPDSSTVPRYILVVRENMPVRGLGVDSARRKCEGLWNRVSKSWQNSRKLGKREKLTFFSNMNEFLDESGTMQALENSWKDSCDELDV